METTKDFALESVTKIYYGKDHACRCGCKGKYVYKGENNFDKLYQKAYNYFSDPAMVGVVEIEQEYNYLNISLKGNKAITLYND